ncbi:MAG: RluA family pseudouridine synthase [Cyclobacteriaceae bacterium]|nr:RluA family pseudouridine synthase [Cyclobacteriaceae bacterium HetDA_MAG_MS6]
MKNRYVFPDIVVHEDEDWIIVNKPPGISTLEDRNDKENILAWARSYSDGAKVCHRLDKNTSGLLVIAKHDQAYKFFAKKLEQREVHKLYHAVISGRVELEEEEINMPIYSSSSKSRIDIRDGKPSVTLVSTLAVYQRHTLLACMPFTGRMHQIRVHLAHIGFPIAGDIHYGGEHVFLSTIKRKFKLSKFEEEKPLMSRMALHAQGLIFENPVGEKLSIQAPYPKDFAVLIKQLDRHR